MVVKILHFTGGVGETGVTLIYLSVSINVLDVKAEIKTKEYMHEDVFLYLQVFTNYSN